jgi:hypothetical protein
MCRWWLTLRPYLPNSESINSKINDAGIRGAASKAVTRKNNGFWA